LGRDLKTGAGLDTSAADRFQQIGRKDVHKLRGMAPLVGVSKTLRENVTCLPVGLFIEQYDIVGGKLLMQPIDRNTMSTSKMAHSGVPASLTYSNHGLVILMDKQSNRPSSEDFP
jgi:hypothetical protein